MNLLVPPDVARSLVLSVEEKRKARAQKEHERVLKQAQKKLNPTLRRINSVLVRSAKEGCRSAHIVIIVVPQTELFELSVGSWLRDAVIRYIRADGYTVEETSQRTPDHQQRYSIRIHW